VSIIISATDAYSILLLQCHYKHMIILRLLCINISDMFVSVPHNFIDFFNSYFIVLTL
jgi:hypothetical protein